jgi:hypothetical protein
MHPQLKADARRLRRTGSNARLRGVPIERPFHRTNDIPNMSSAIQFDDNAACAGCGRFGAYVFDAQQLCGDCYEKRGSCCPEFGADDLWRREESTSPDIHLLASSAGNRTVTTITKPARQS